jgi:hypothetical protein
LKGTKAEANGKESETLIEKSDPNEIYRPYEPKDRKTTWKGGEFYFEHKAVSTFELSGEYIGTSLNGTYKWRSVDNVTAVHKSGARVAIYLSTTESSGKVTGQSSADGIVAIYFDGPVIRTTENFRSGNRTSQTFPDPLGNWAAALKK